MKSMWLDRKFRIEVIGIAASLLIAIILASTSKRGERTEKLMVPLFSAGLFYSLLRLKLELVTELNEVKDAIVFYAKTTRSISDIELPVLRIRAEHQIQQTFERIQALANGHIVLEPYESIPYQAGIIRAATSRIFAVHTVKDERDLLKWLKKDGEFNVLRQAYIDAKGRLKPEAMVRVFVVASELISNEKCMRSLQEVKALSEETLGFKSSIVLREMQSLDAQAYCSLLLVDVSGLVIVRMEGGPIRGYQIVAFEGKGLQTRIAENDFKTWMSLDNAVDMSAECFALLRT